MNDFETAILPSVYLGSIRWYSKLFLYGKIGIERHEHYIKQTYRNRCRIVGSNGIQDLIIPVHQKENHTPMHEIEIDYDGNWQRQHWQSICSAYGNSPFFDFYDYYFSPFYKKNDWKNLIDFNSDLLSTTMKLLKCKKEIQFTTEYFPSYENAADFRKTFSPKKESDESFHPKRYVQVFEERHGFIPNLSIIDLLCCCGPDANGYF